MNYVFMYTATQDLKLYSLSLQLENIYIIKLSAKVVNGRVL